MKNNKRKTSRSCAFQGFPRRVLKGCLRFVLPRSSGRRRRWGRAAATRRARSGRGRAAGGAAGASAAPAGPRAARAPPGRPCPSRWRRGSPPPPPAPSSPPSRA
eukprot:1195527-Prorocentrum_minimum.AAC.2